MTDIPILWQDEHLVVVDKPAGMLVVPAPGRRGQTVGDVVTGQLGVRAMPVHRLDEHVTGALVLALRNDSKSAVEQIFRKHEAERIYLALLSRAPNPPAGRIESKLREGKDGVVRSVLDGRGEQAITDFVTLRREGRFTLVECRLHTGRRNQIRAHMSDLSCPIVGDRKYGFRVRGGPSYSRPLLHAEQVRFTHPITGAEVHVVSEAGETELRR